MDDDHTLEVVRQALRLLAKHSPRLRTLCYWAGTSSIAMEELHHRQSFDLDFHTKKALQDVRPILAEIQAAFPGGFDLVHAPDEFGSGFQGVLALPGGERITVEVLSNYEHIRDGETVSAKTVRGMQRVSLSRYLADKIQCVAERVEARDLVDIRALLRQRPEMERDARRLLAEQDAAILAERLLAWTDDAIARDLAAYPEVNPNDAQEVRDLLLAWLKAIDVEIDPT